VPSPSEFFRGKNITMIVSSASGGGYDALSRMPHIFVIAPLAKNDPTARKKGRYSRLPVKIDFPQLLPISH
jgi:hypothetical protein